jgi:hypothetical protein
MSHMIIVASWMDTVTRYSMFNAEANIVGVDCKAYESPTPSNTDT